MRSDEPGLFPPADGLAAVLRNPFFLSRVYGFAGGEDLEEALSVTDESFQAFEVLFEERGRKEPDPDDEDLVFRLLSIPLYLPGDHTWELEVYDNGEDAGVTHFLPGPGAPARVTLAVHDSQPRLPVLRWAEAQALFDALERDARNHASGVAAVGPLLLWAAVGPSEDDPRGAIRARLEEAWRRSGVVDAGTAERLAAASASRRPSPWRPHPTLGWVLEGGHSLRVAEDGFGEAAFRVFRAFLDALTEGGA